MLDMKNTDEKITFCSIHLRDSIWNVTEGVESLFNKFTGLACNFIKKRHPRRSLPVLLQDTSNGCF